MFSFILQTQKSPRWAGLMSGIKKLGNAIKDLVANRLNIGD